MTCTSCGAQLDSTSTTCLVCGAAVEAPAPVGAPAATGSAPVGVPSSQQVSAQADRTGVGDAGEGPEDPWGRGDGGASGLPPGSGSGGGAVPPPGGTPWGAPQPHPSGLSSEVRGWAIGAHLGGLVLAMATAATLGFLAPLVVWLVKRDEHPYIDHHAKAALNFQLTVLVAVLGSIVLAIPAVIVGILTFGIGLLLLGVVAVAAMIAWVVLPVLGAVKAANGEGFSYPLTIPFVR